MTITYNSDCINNIIGNKNVNDIMNDNSLSPKQKKEKILSNINNINQCIESFKNMESTPAPYRRRSVTTTSAGSLYLVFVMIGFFISCYAVYLSWTCNTEGGIDTGLKIIYAIFAFMFGIFYIIFYFIFRAGYCGKKIGGRR